ncbi:hypothetical protein [Parachryseolinea silvisoli]|uniref:hypothetical protein n=1 Tax=Parachryseolinea silvisoli TaxID=2873601 RepID=UPI0022658DC2|nr:hypothetical protein [Parachryseolinea silvisoli]MCD9015545.1 hypothetical protein [Parachryseolinea silvisoli]
MNDFEKPFRDALTDLEVTPPEGGWPPIEAALDRRGFDYRMYGLLLLLLLLIGLGSLVSYHVATHAVGQQRAATVVQHAASSKGTLPAPSAVVHNTVEVPCDSTTSATGASADTDDHRVLAGDNTGSIPGSNVEVACTPRVDAGEVYEYTVRSNDLARQRPVAIGATRDHARRRNQDDEPLRHRGGTARAAREQKNDDGQGNDEGRELLARHTNRPGTAIHVAREETVGRGKDAGRGNDTEGDSVTRALNGPPMPFRKRNIPQAELLALTPLDGLDRLRAEETKTKVLKSDSVEEKKRAERARSKWSIQFQAGANYTFKKMDPAKDLYYVTGLNNKNQASWRNTGYQLSVTVRYPLARRTMLTTGISWNMLQEHTDYNYYNIIADSVEVQHIADKSIEVNAYSSVRRNDVTNTLHYLGVQVGVIQQVMFLRHERNILLALHVNRQVAVTNRTLHAGHRFTVNDMRIALRAGLENRVMLSQHHVLTLTPFLEQSFGSVYSEESVYTLRPIQVGLDVGLVLPFYRRR